MIVITTFLVYLVVLYVNDVSCFRLNEPGVRMTTSPKVQGLQMATGGHGDGFRFMPAVKLDKDEYWPQILPIAGIMGDMTVEDLYAPPQVIRPEQGMWAYDFSNPDMPQLGTVPFPGSERLYWCDDPVVVIATNEQLGLRLSETVEVMIVVDRRDREWDKESSFFLFKTPDDGMKVLWSDDGVPAGHQILGKVAVVSVPLTRSMRKADAMFEEE